MDVPDKADIDGKFSVTSRWNGVCAFVPQIVEVTEHDDVWSYHRGRGVVPIYVNGRRYGQVPAQELKKTRPEIYERLFPG